MSNPIKTVYMMTDLEGVAGVVSFEPQAYPTGRYYDNARRLLTAEINASIEGLLAEGVERVIVADGHGHGGVVYEELHEAAELIHGRPITAFQLLASAEECDAAIMVGQHARSGVPTANQNHTSSEHTVDWKKLNGEPIGEIALFSLYVGCFDVPMIFLSGDEDACAEAEALIPNITTAAVKRGLGRNCARSLSAARARQKIREGVREAIRRQDSKPVASLTRSPPYALEVRVFHTDTADAVESSCSAERVDGQTVRLRGDDLRQLLYRM